MVLTPIYFITAICSFVLSGVLFQYREQTAVLPLSIFAFFAGVWSSTMAVTALIQNPPGWWFETSLLIIGFCSSVTIPAIVVFALQYTGREKYVTKKLLALLSIDPIATVALVLYDPFNIYIIDAYPIEGTLTGYEIVAGPLYYMNFIFAMTLFFTAIALIIHFVVTSRYTLYRGQSIALVLGSIIMIVGGIPTILGVVEEDITPLVGLFGISLYTFAIIRYQFGDIVPIGRRKVIDSIRDGVIILNSREKIIDCNDAGATFLNESSNKIVGENIEYAFQNQPDLLEMFYNSQASDEIPESINTITIGDHHLDVKINKVVTSSNTNGWIILLQDITEQQEKQRRLEQQVEQLDQFTSVVSHDLRNPLSIAHGWTSQAQQSGNVENLDKVKDSLNRMNNMIEDVLELAQSGSATLETNPLQLSTIFRRAEANTETDFATLTVADDIHIEADEGQLKRLFENLIRNSLEHGLTDERREQIENGSTDDLLELTIGIENESDRTCSIYFADDGVGIPDSKQDKVFESGFTTNEEGTGFGLMIVKQVANAHGWSVNVTDSDTGGAKFIFSDIRKTSLPQTETTSKQPIESD